MSVEMRSLGGSSETRPSAVSTKKRPKRRSLAALMFTHGAEDLEAGDGEEAKRNTYRKSLSATGIDDANALPVREMLQQLHRIKRDKTVFDCCIFSVFLILFLGITTTVMDVHESFSTDAAVEDLFLDEEFGPIYKKNFYEIMTYGELWDWMEGPLLNGLYPDEYYNGRPYTEGELGYVLHYLRLVGGVQLRQARVTNSSCLERRFLDETALHNGTEMGRYDTKGGWCYSEFSSSRQRTAPFGPPSDPTRYKFSEGLSNLEGLWGFGSSYGTGGYVTQLPLNRTAARATVAQMKQDLWTDASTRAVAVDFSLYNTNTKLLTAVRIVFEMGFTGRMIKYSKIFSIKLVIYGWSSSGVQDWSDVVRAGGEAVYIILLAYFFQKEGRRAFHTRPWHVYFMHFGNVFEALLLLLNVYFLYQWGQVVFDSRRTNFTVQTTEFVDMFSLAERYVMSFTGAGGIGLLYSLKLFRFLAINKKMNTMWTTLRRASTDLAAFLIGFASIAAGFAVFGQYSFGYMLSDFHNVTSSFSTLLRFPLGDFSYEDLTLARPLLASVFFSLYIGIVFFVMINIIIGIITLYFDIVFTEARRADRWKKSAKSLESDFMARASSIMQRMSCCNRFLGWEGLEDIREKEQQDWNKERAFLKQLRLIMRLANRGSNVDLYNHVEKVLKSSVAGSTFLSVNEICLLIKPKVPCKGVHTQCEAQKLMTLYKQLKQVTLIGRVTTHEAADTRAAKCGSRKYKVRKLNRYGSKQRRVLMVDHEDKFIYNFDRHGRLRKSLPLEQLVQVDTSKTDDRKVDLQFTEDPNQSRVISAMEDDEEREKAVANLKGLETRYELLFDSKGQRAAFIKEVLACLNSAEPGRVERERADSLGRRRKSGVAAMRAMARLSATAPTQAGTAAASDPIMEARMKALLAQVVALQRQVAEQQRRRAGVVG